jgi:cyclophilin family peptidyl-prolyl cis-trans isomerase
MPRKKQVVQKQKRQKTYAPGEMAGDFTHVKPKGVFKIFSNYPLFAAIGVVAIAAGLLITVLLGGGSGVSSDENGVRGEGVTRRTPEAGATAEATSSSGAADEIKQYGAPPPLTIDPNKAYTATLKTEQGDITVTLDAKAAPAAVNNFVFLAKDGYYNGTTFFRVVADDAGTLHFAQGGDPTGTGSGGPGYELPFEETSTGFTSGTLAMAKPDGAGRLNNGSQFFFTLTDEPTLDGKNTAFGKVTDGLDVLQGFAPRDSSMEDPPPGVRIESIEITES